MSGTWERPDWVRRINAFGAAIGDPAAVVPLAADELLELAQATTGLSDFGDDYEVEAFRQRIASIDTDAGATVLGRLFARAEALRMLKTRLRLQSAWAAHPEILDEVIEAPVFIVGPPRTGTSILFELLALDARLRVPLSWEAHHPLPAGDLSALGGATAEQRLADERERMAWAEAEQELWADTLPEFMAVHELRHDLPCECVHFMAIDFQSGYWPMLYETPSYDLWASDKPDLVDATYRNHRRFLQTLQWLDRQQGIVGRRWLLKTPGHLMSMEQLFTTYPDACVIATHRDPLKWVGSAASTMSMLRSMRNARTDLSAHGEMAAVGFRFMVDLVDHQRAEGSLPGDAFIDSHFADLMADAPSAVQRIYDGLGQSWPDGHGQRISNYLANKPRAKFGRHTYELSTFGLDEVQVRADFAGYVERHGIAAEA